MGREEVIVLVSRAIGCMQAMYGLVDASYLPERVMSWHHYAKLAARLKDMPSYEPANYFLTLDRVELAFLFGRIAFLGLMAFLFWNCGPRIARFLLPERKNQSPVV